MSDITEFKGEHRWLSNFWSCVVELDGMYFQSVEAAYVAAKTNDIKTREQIQSLSTPGDCKRFGRKIKLRADWDGIKLSVMENLLRQKFKYGSDLGKKLTCTIGEIVEGNSWGDTFWGVCNGVGENNLGKILMKIRAELTAAEIEDAARAERIRNGV